MQLSLQNLSQLLERTAQYNRRKGIVFYMPESAHKAGVHITYSDVFLRAKSQARLLSQIEGVGQSSKILLHFDTHMESILWFWSVTLAGYIPVISAPFTHDLDQRRRHVLHLKTLLDDPICLTSQRLLSEFAEEWGLNVHSAEQIQLAAGFVCSTPMVTLISEKPSVEEASVDIHLGCGKRPEDRAVLMLTSGSTGNAKAVCLRHGQILKAIDGKRQYFGLRKNNTFLNWIGLDHVANLTEVHLHAMLLGAEQIHVQAADLCEPLVFLDLINRHRVVYTFAPNFFLANLRQALIEHSNANLLGSWDLTCLEFLISGGEANIVETCDALSDLLHSFGAPANVIVPGFGMTETCAGAIYSKDCPSYDLTNSYEFASLGRCIPGIAMRVRTDDGRIATLTESGDLEVSGPVVFTEYFNNPKATAEAFSSDGWFITGDRARIDAGGHLNLVGRTKEMIIINGVKYYPHELETALEEATLNSQDITRNYTLVFPYRTKGSQTESFCVGYLPTRPPGDVESRLRANDLISKISLLHCGALPHKIIPLNESHLQKSALGKLSRGKIRNGFEQGRYDEIIPSNETAISTFKSTNYEPPRNEVERIIIGVLGEVFDVPRHEIDANSSITTLGVSSVVLIKMKKILEVRLNFGFEIPLVLMMTNTSIREMATALKELKMGKSYQYNPVVVLQSKGSQIPLWLVHPGVGEVLVFLNLAKHMLDRPMYALRARGFEEGEEFFQDIAETIQTYHVSIKRMQPSGPYAIAGYSYGSMLAFEIAKLLESNNDEVKFIGSFNLPPHIKLRMRQLDWIEVLLNLSYFLDLISEAYAVEISTQMHLLPHDEALSHILRVTSATSTHRVEELALTEKRLMRWTDLAYGL